MAPSTKRLRVPAAQARTTVLKGKAVPEPLWRQSADNMMSLKTVVGI
eukprot:CAMPEP_0179315344 /NCGR_PEP_ID=MMETSP0797-20121207/55001_1 /TAXON_ID=47934 /ORGANISM="Dinophysis acuminata, Strain DAEP01" /LENGTH=46 /DNA_ID= /DNA_START= /DNA_END= /DNA_ORIENTATION=